MTKVALSVAVGLSYSPFAAGITKQYALTVNIVFPVLGNSPCFDVVVIAIPASVRTKNLVVVCFLYSLPAILAYYIGFYGLIRSFHFARYPFYPRWVSLCM